VILHCATWVQTLPGDGVTIRRSKYFHGENSKFHACRYAIDTVIPKACNGDVKVHDVRFPVRVFNASIVCRLLSEPLHRVESSRRVVWTPEQVEHG
jgi:hypothetical protein